MKFNSSLLISAADMPMAYNNAGHTPETDNLSHFYKQHNEKEMVQKSRIMFCKILFRMFKKKESSAKMLGFKSIKKVYKHCMLQTLIQ